MKNVSLAIAYCFRGTVHQCFMRSMLQLTLADGNQRKAMGAILEIETLYLPEGRNAAVRRFVQTECDALLFIDTDIAFSTEDVYAMLDIHAQHPDAILAGLYYVFATVERGISPVWFTHTLPPPMETLNDVDLVAKLLETKGTYPILGCGMGFTLIPRAVIADHPWGGQYFGGQGREVGPEGFVGEDIFFCHKATDFGVSILATGVKVGHMKSTML